VLPDALASLDAATLVRLEQDLARLLALLGADPAGARGRCGWVMAGKKQPPDGPGAQELLT
jgi:hypothetical protein